MKVLKVISMCPFLLLTPLCANAQTASGIIDRHLKAVGAKSAFWSINTVMIKFCNTNQNTGKKSFQTLYLKRPNLCRIEMENSSGNKRIGGL